MKNFELEQMQVHHIQIEKEQMQEHCIQMKNFEQGKVHCNLKMVMNIPKMVLNLVKQLMSK